MISTAIYLTMRSGGGDFSSEELAARSQPTSKHAVRRFLPPSNLPRTGEGISTANGKESAHSAEEEEAGRHDRAQAMEIEELRERVRDLTREGNAAEAVRLCLDSLKSDPENPSLKMELGFAYAEDGRLDLAKMIFEERLKEDPGDAEANFGIGAVERQLGNVDDALDYFKEALRVDPEHFDAKYGAADILTFERSRKVEAAELYLAEKYYKDVLGAAPGDADARNGLAAIYLSTGRAAEAVEAWESLARDAPDESVIFSNLGEAYLATDRPSEAYRSAQRALEIDPENSDAYFFIGRAEIAMGNREAGIEAISRAAEMDPENADYARELLRLAGE